MSLFPVRGSAFDDLCVIIYAMPTFRQHFSRRTSIHLVNLELIYLCEHASACDILSAKIY